MANVNENYKVELVSTEGACDTDLFKVMATKGDITSEPIKKAVGEEICVMGTAFAHITTKKDKYDLYYYYTNIGIFHTSSEVFDDSVNDYMEFTNVFLVKAVECKLGETYKAVPITNPENHKKSETKPEEFPFN